MAAEGAANFRATLDAKPSLFEWIAAKSLNSTLHPALQRLTNFLATVNPTKLGWTSAYYDELFLAANILLEGYYLKRADASFSESFYGLQRVSANTSYSCLSNETRRLSLLYLTVLPYVKRKLDERLQTYKAEVEALPRFANFRVAFIRTFVAFCSVCEVAYGILTIRQYLRYMAGKTDHPSLPLQLLNVKLIYSTEQKMSNFWALAIVQNCVELGAFCMQFLQAWNSEHTNYNFKALPTVIPPLVDSEASNYKGKCPLCLQKWKIPTCLPVSGYVFCFACIIRHLREHQTCPVTNLPAKTLDVIRLYDSEN